MFSALRTYDDMLCFFMTKWSMGNLSVIMTGKQRCGLTMGRMLQDSIGVSCVRPMFYSMMKIRIAFRQGRHRGRQTGRQEAHMHRWYLEYHSVKGKQIRFLVFVSRNMWTYCALSCTWEVNTYEKVFSSVERVWQRFIDVALVLEIYFCYIFGSLNWNVYSLKFVHHTEFYAIGRRYVFFNTSRLDAGVLRCADYRHRSSNPDWPNIAGSLISQQHATKQTE